MKIHPLLLLYSRDAGKQPVRLLRNDNTSHQEEGDL